MDAPPDKDGWRLRVPEPRDRSRTVSTVMLRNESLSTSGSYEKFFQLGNQKYCHVMDPREGAPVQGVLQTTLIASDSTTTDALSNAMFVMGAPAGSELIASVTGAHGLWILDEPESLQLVKWRWQDYKGDGLGQMPVLVPKKEGVQPER